ncbi:YybS family protein [Bacillus sp. ISL-40]|uniref:YybS family protein n=1 Tax=unclassified Bacillus (in: firmicutes) TaxID=185979 RepID=UPI001BE78AAE|nr:MULTISPECIES: YybS family protein [unclassified Bacillus (in: firmicutes)]MBT2696839.1 YybS family protein [Bacillus sp. ISL-40]MBT2719882.1 YybS family protein [Bacillus sp. ISL-46]MBT2742557.1 YybS family protein [Bacillus sp. ISL-77]
MKDVRKLTEGAVLLAAFAALLLITIYVPVVGSILNLVLPLPFIMFSVKNNLKLIAAFLVAAIFIAFIAGSLMGVGLMLIYGSVGAVIGYLLQKGKSRTFILIASSLTFMAGLVISYVVMVAFMKIDIIHELTVALNESVKSSEVMLKAMGREDQVELLKEQNALMLKQIVTLAPSALIFASILSSFITQWICFPIAKRFGVNVQPWGSFRNLVLPKSLLWYYLIALGMMLLFHPQEGTYLYSILINARYILETFIMLQGLALLFFIFHQKSVAKGLAVLVVILTFMIPIVRYIIMLLGITDLGFDFRKRFEMKE